MASGEWTLTGTVTNSLTTTTSFQIVVDFVSAKGDTVLSTTEVNVSGVRAGGSAAWSASGAKGKSDVACDLRQAQTT
jgi:hypothetical protein